MTIGVAAVLCWRLNIPEKLKMNHLRHGSAKSSQVYDHATSKTHQRVQSSLHSGFNYTKKKKDQKKPAPLMSAASTKSLVPSLESFENDTERPSSLSPRTDLKIEVFAELKKLLLQLQQKEKLTRRPPQ